MLVADLHNRSSRRMEHDNDNHHHHHPKPKPNSTSDADSVLSSGSSHLSRAELVRRRLENLNRLSNCYRDIYWALMGRLKALYTHYLWACGLSPFKDDADSLHNFPFRCDCTFLGCSFKAMPLTTFCHLHILSDSCQKLYKPCNYVIKCAQAGPITCGKPILRSIVPSLCTVHFQKAQKHLTRTFKRTGLNISSTSKVAPKFHVLVTEYVHHIQVKRRKELKGNKSKIVVQNQK